MSGLLSTSIRSTIPQGYTTPTFPSLYYPVPVSLNHGYYLYYTSDVWRFTVYWTLAFYGAIHLAASGYACIMQWQNWRIIWITPVVFLLIAALEAVIAGSIVGGLLGAVYEAGSFRMSTWIPFVEDYEGCTTDISSLYEDPPGHSESLQYSAPAVPAAAADAVTLAVLGIDHIAHMIILTNTSKTFATCGLLLCSCVPATAAVILAVWDRSYCSYDRYQPTHLRWLQNVFCCSAPAAPAATAVILAILVVLGSHLFTHVFIPHEPVKMVQHLVCCYPEGIPFVKGLLIAHSSHGVTWRNHGSPVW